jgi:Flp pilus assembly protein TadG
MAAVRIAVPMVSRLSELVRRIDGVSSVEFAIVLPFMALLYVGGVEVGEAIAIDYKTTITARAVADLASQYPSINNSTMTGILAASSVIITPYPSSTMVVTVSEVSIDASRRATITWSDSLNGTARTVGQVVALPSAIDTASTTLIWGEVTYSYTPQIGQILTGTYAIYENIFLYPRVSGSISRVNS